MNIFKKGQLTKQEFISNFIKLAVAFLIFGLTWGLQFPNDTLTSDGDLQYSAFHLFFNIGFFLLGFIYVALTISKTISIDQNEKVSYDFAEQSEETANRNLIKNLIITLVFVLLAVIANTLFIGSKNLYNKSVVLTNQFAQVKQEQRTFYDNTWKTYSLKDGIKVDNKETFIEVTKILMEGRKDGNQLATKLLVENQAVPYSEFSKFYADLSRFIEAKRGEYQILEVKTQNIALEHNNLLDVFPNNVYNLIVNRPRINYVSGFTSDYTEKVYTNKKENFTPAKNLELK